MNTRITIFTIILLALAWCGFAPEAQAVVPAPDGGYPGGNTAEGQNALFSLTTGVWNTALGGYTLYSDTRGRANTAVGLNALRRNVDGEFNTAVGLNALFSNNGDPTTGQAIDNCALGIYALFANITGSFNSAFGSTALISNTTGAGNTAIGSQALYNNATGRGNTALGSGALRHNGIGNGNTAIGDSAGVNITGTGNVCIGQGVAGVIGENNHTYIRNINTTQGIGGVDYVTVDLNTGLLGHYSSSRRYKEEIKPMDKASETLYLLKPVTYRFKKKIDPSRNLQYGLVAEDVAQVDPNLAIRDGKGQIESVHFNAVNAMLLNEFLKEHKKVAEQQSKIAKQQVAIADLKSRLIHEEKSFESKLADQEQRIAELASGLQKVNAQLATAAVSSRTAGGLEVSRSAEGVVVSQR